VLTKVAAKKTAGVLGDDLALNAQQVAGVDADRELPVVWAVAKGSAINKLILVPVALAISQFAPWAVTPLLMFGGLFLCFEGVEKLAHKFLHKEEEASERAELREALLDPSVDLVAFEKDKIKGAVRTDFVLSAEIIAITLGAVAGAPFATRLSVLIGISALMTVGVYGFVAAIVKIDDAGLYLNAKTGSGSFAQLQRGLGKLLLLGAPVLMKTLSVAGTAAMFLVGGGILTHGLPVVHHAIEHLADEAKELPGGGVLSAILPPVGDGIFGVIAGAFALGAMSAFQHTRKRFAS
jgi:predicted DNA repair protein MutK